MKSSKYGMMNLEKYCSQGEVSFPPPNVPKKLLILPPLPRPHTHPGIISVMQEGRYVGYVGHGNKNIVETKDMWDLNQQDLMAGCEGHRGKVSGDAGLCGVEGDGCSGP